uniref:UBC core domain-containing protein n=1 Tax=Canis lupus familiaris TaxID=9615 RepID=A0A8I3PRZ1_CANLF
MMRAPALAVVVQMQTSETRPLQNLKNKKKENLLPPSRRKTPNSLAKPLLLSTSAKRIQKELAEISLDLPPNCSAGPKGDNIYEWRWTILGPPGSVYEDCNPVDPLVGSIATHYLTNRAEHDRIARQWTNWSPASTISKILLSICSLLTDCNPVDPLVGSIATHYLTNRAEHDRIARQWTKRYAT